jgi:hypothetical protein
MIGGIIIIFTLILAFFEKPHLFKKPIKTEKVIIIVIIIGTAIFSIVKDRFEEDEQDANALIIRSSAKTIDSLKSNSDIQKGLIVRQSILIDSLRSENKTAAQEYQDSLKNYHYNTIALLAKYGLKVDTLRGEVSKMGSHEQAHLALLAENSAGFKAIRSLDTFKLSGWIVNDGTGQAYGIYIKTHLLFVLNGSIYRYKWVPEIQRDNDEVVPNRAMAIEHGMLLSDATYSKITSFVLIIFGYYYTDYEKKNKRNINLAIEYDPGSNKISSIGVVDFDKLLKSAKFADFLYK